MKKYAFIDEFGAHGFNFNTSGNSTHFILAVVLVDSNNLVEAKTQAEKIRSRFFQRGEMKSSNIKVKDYARRSKLIDEIVKLPIKLYYFVCDKREIYSIGLKTKGIFYKYLHELTYKELRLTFSNVSIIADKFGRDDYQKSFIKYIKKQRYQSDLFSSYDIELKDSKEEVLIQVADIIAGALSFDYDANKLEHGFDFREKLNEILLRKKTFPQKYFDFDISRYELTTQKDNKIAEISHRRAVEFIENHKNSNNEDRKLQSVILEYLLNYCNNIDSDAYLLTNIIKAYIRNLGYEKPSRQQFRKHIGAMRDEGVIIASSRAGYKIPVKYDEVLKYIEHSFNVIVPMISRMKQCNDAGHF